MTPLRVFNRLRQAHAHRVGRAGLLPALAQLDAPRHPLPEVVQAPRRIPGFAGPGGRATSNDTRPSLRAIPRLDIKGPTSSRAYISTGEAVAGDPVLLAARYYREGADEFGEVFEK